MFYAENRGKGGIFMKKKMSINKRTELLWSNKSSAASTEVRRRILGSKIQIIIICYAQNTVGFLQLSG